MSNFLVNKARMLIVRELEVIRYWLFDLRSLGPLNPSVSCWMGFFSHCSWAHLDEPLHDKTNKMTCVPSKTQISLGIHPVWSVFADRMKKHWALNYLLSAQWRLWSDSRVLCSLSPTPIMLHIKFDQDWPAGFRDIQVWNFRHSRASNSKMSGLIRPKIKLDWAFMPGYQQLWWWFDQ